MANRGQWLLGVAFSLTLHVIIFVSILFGANWARSEQPKTRQIQVVNAVFMDDVRRQMEAEKQRSDREKRRLEEKRRQEQLAKKREQERQERIAQEKEQARLKELERKKQQKLKAEKERQAKEAEIARQKKAEQERIKKEKLAQEKLAKEKAAKEKLAAEKRLKEKKRQEQIAKEKKLAEQRKKEAAQKKRAAEQKARESALAAMMAEEEQLRLDSELERKRDEYRYLIQQKVQSNWIRPAGTAEQFECLVNVKQIPGGDVVSARVVQSCGSILLDQSVLKAIEDSSPLPDGDPRVVERELEFTFRPDI